MPVRRLPVRPDADQLRHQARDLLRALHASDPVAIAELHEFHPTPPGPTAARLADVQLVLARSYQASSWPRLMQAVNLTVPVTGSSARLSQGEPRFPWRV